VLNRGAGWQTIFRTEEDYAAFQKILEEAHARFGMRLLGYSQSLAPRGLVWGQSRVAGKTGVWPVARGCGVEAPSIRAR
jgi:hypothetical protein